MTEMEKTKNHPTFTKIKRVCVSKIAIYSHLYSRDLFFAKLAQASLESARPELLVR